MSLAARLKTWTKRRLGVPQNEFVLGRLARAGFHPDLIFDVGAHQGDFAWMCRQYWNDCEIACFEVQQGPLERLTERFAGDTKIRTWPCLLGAAAQEGVALHLCDTGSSVLEEHVCKHADVAFFPMRTVDDVVSDYAPRVPQLLKLDVQGYELDVLRGAAHALQKAEAILVELNLIDIHCNVPLMADVVHWLAERGWVAYDIGGFVRRPYDDALWQVDMAFVPDSSRFRSDKRYR